jgi:signal transduction histidine kinase
VPIIFLTAYYNEDQHVLAGYSTGAVDYLHKPVNAVILRSKVAVFAELFRRTRDCVTTGRALLAEVTARRLAEEQLRELNETLEQRIARSTGALEESHRRKDEFLAMLSHELRNPLAPITSAVQLLRLDEKQDPLQRQASKVIERQVHQLTRLVDDLLEVSRISTGRIHLQPERVDAGEIVTRAVETVRPMLEQRGHALALALSPQPIYLYGDALRLEQVVVNLLTNATKYTDKGGQIWVTTQREGDECVLRVRDTGIGIAPEFLPHIFDLFSQAKRSLDRSQGGLGIGLAVVKGLVTMHHGRVEAESTPGQGCELVVRLPVMVDPAPEPSATHGKSTWPAGTSLRVLIVDDNEDAASMLGSLLEAWGHRVEMTHSGPAALVAALEFRPHVALMDIGLPEMDGYEVARTLRRQAIFDDLVLVATTGYGTDVDRQLSQAAGFDHHLVKPPDLEKLRRLLADVAAPRSVARPAS